MWSPGADEWEKREKERVEDTTSFPFSYNIFSPLFHFFPSSHYQFFTPFPPVFLLPSLSMSFIRSSPSFPLDCQLVFNRALSRLTFPIFQQSLLSKTLFFCIVKSVHDWVRKWHESTNSGNFRQRAVNRKECPWSRKRKRNSRKRKGRRKLRGLKRYLKWEFKIFYKSMKMTIQLKEVAPPPAPKFPVKPKAPSKHQLMMEQLKARGVIIYRVNENSSGFHWSREEQAKEGSEEQSDNDDSCDCNAGEETERGRTAAAAGEPTWWTRSGICTFWLTRIYASYLMRFWLEYSYLLNFYRP